VKNAVDVQFTAYRDKDEHKTFWVQVNVVPKELQAEYVRDIHIHIYQADQELGGALTSYEMQNGKSYGWDLTYSDVIVVLVLYRDSRYGEMIAAQGVWVCDGEYLRSAKTLRGRSELFA
jgi:hypothetical protein